MSDKQEQLFNERDSMGTINDPKTYREMLVPHASPDEAEKAYREFAMEVYALRCKHRIPELLMTARMNVQFPGGAEGPVMILSQFGNEHESESLAAYAFGHIQAQRQERIASIAAAGTIKRGEKRK